MQVKSKYSGVEMSINPKNRVGACLHAYRSDLAAFRSGAAQAVRRHRARGLLADRGTGRDGARRDPVRQRRFHHLGHAGADARPGAAARSDGDGLDRHLHADDRADPPPRATSSTCCTSTSTTSRCRCSAGRTRRSSPRCTGGSTFPNSRRSTKPSPMRRSSRSRTRSAGRSRASTGCAPCCTACRRNLLTPQPVSQHYAAFLGRISPEKGVDKAIRIAGAAGMRLKIAAKVDNADKEYYENEIRPLIEASPWSSSSARSTTRRSRHSCPARMPCCSRSTGRSRSAW